MPQVSLPLYIKAKLFYFPIQCPHPRGFWRNLRKNKNNKIKWKYRILLDYLSQIHKWQDKARWIYSIYILNSPKLKLGYTIVDNTLGWLLVLSRLHGLYKDRLGLNRGFLLTWYEKCPNNGNKNWGKYLRLWKFCV